MKLSRNYMVATVIILSIEVLIALYVNDKFVRPFLGDTLAVILVYCFIKIIIRERVLMVAILSLCIAFVIEILQATNFIECIGLEDIKLARIVLGTSFSWGDILAYIAGAVLVIIFDRKRSKRVTWY